MALELDNSISTNSTAADPIKMRASGVKISMRERQFFTEQLALLLDTGTNLHNGLQTMTRQCTDTRSRDLIQDLSEQITGGKSFSDALERHPASFSGTYVNLVRAGESGGFLPEVLEQLMQMEERRDKLRTDVVAAISYPAFLLFFSVSVVIFVLIVVFPKFEEMFASIADQLPATTLFLMSFSDTLRSNYVAISIFLIIFIALCIHWVRSDGGRRQLDRFALYTPVVRSIYIPLYIVQSLRMMSVSLSNGVSVMDTLHACREVVANSFYRKFITDVEQTVQDGAGIALGFRRADFMPNIVKEMISTGEESGSLPKVMDRIARHYETDLEKRLATVSRMAEPVMLIVMGLVVGILVSSLILPIFQLSSSAR